MKIYKNILGYYIIMSDEEKTPNELLMDYINIYLAPKNRESKGDELEVKFGTKQYNQITKIDFDNIIQKLKSLGFSKVSEEYYLNINTEYADERTGRMKDSNIRVTVSGISNIQKYCNYRWQNSLYPNTRPSYKFFFKNC